MNEGAVLPHRLAPQVWHEHDHKPDHVAVSGYVARPTVDAGHRGRCPEFDAHSTAWEQTDLHLQHV